MSVVNRLRGKPEKSNRRRVECPKCGRTIAELHIVKTRKGVKKLCPYCGYKFKPGDINSSD